MIASLWVVEGSRAIPNARQAAHRIGKKRELILEIQRKTQCALDVACNALIHFVRSQEKKGAFCCDSCCLAMQERTLLIRNESRHDIGYDGTWFTITITEWIGCRIAKTRCAFTLHNTALFSPCNSPYIRSLSAGDCKTGKMRFCSSMS